MEVERIIKMYLKSICLLCGLRFEDLKFSYSTENNNFYCYVDGDKRILSFLIGRNGQNAISLRKVLAFILRKNNISQRVKLIFGKK